MADFKSRPNYKIIKKIGYGAFGSVYKVINQNDNKIYAIKKIDLNDNNKANLYLIENESILLKTINSEFIIKYIDSFLENDSFNIIMEYCENSDLRTFIDKHKKENKLISGLVINIIIYELAKGIKVIHSKKAIHRDLKPENIFISNDYKIKIGDFGLSKILNGTNYAHTLAGTLSYMAPEIINGSNYNNKVDIWALGCIIYELCTLNKCFDSNNILDLVNKIVSRPQGKIDFNYYNINLQKIIDLSLKKDYKERPSIEEVYDLIDKETSNFILNECQKTTKITPDDLSINMLNRDNRDEDIVSKGYWLPFMNNSFTKSLINGSEKFLSGTAIIGLNGISWARYKFPVLKTKEIEKLKDIFNQKTNSVPSLEINNNKYQITNYKEGFLIELKSDKGGGGAIAKTKLAFVVLFYDGDEFYKLDDGKLRSQCSRIYNMAIENLANSIKEFGY